MTLNVKNIASTISLIENNSPKKKDILSKLYSKTGKAQRIGITGPPGAGKSSLIDNLITHLRSRDKKVAVLCIDPTSPFSGGAILGDRIRMLKHHSEDFKISAVKYYYKIKNIKDTYKIKNIKDTYKILRLV